MLTTVKLDVELQVCFLAEMVHHIPRPSRITHFGYVSYITEANDQETQNLSQTT